MQYKSSRPPWTDSNPSVKNTLKHKFLTCNLDYQKPKPLNVISGRKKNSRGTVSSYSSFDLLECSPIGLRGRSIPPLR